MTADNQQGAEQTSVQDFSVPNCEREKVISL